MSRSKKHTPIHGISCCKSNKKFKQQEHRAERKLVNTILSLNLKCKLLWYVCNCFDLIYITEGYYDDLPHPKEYGDEWSSPRDGKIYWMKPKEQDNEWDRIMRK